VGAVVISGCHPADCHYNNANRQTAKRVEKSWKRMEKVGLNKDRLRLAWVSAAEGSQFAKVIQETEQVVNQLTPNEIREGIERVKESMIPKSGMA
jgi:coenzyme F420-reducing hydrogenase delta subunit